MSVRTPTVPVPPKRAVPSDTVVYKDISALITNNDSLGEIFDAAMVVKGNEIAWVGKQADLQDTWNADKVVSMANTIVSPGLINTHNHMNQTLVRCIGTDYPLFNWLLPLYPGMATYTGEDVYVSAKLAMAELIMNGCTTSSITCMCTQMCSLDDTIRASREIGMRFQPVRGIMTMGASRGACLLMKWWKTWNQLWLTQSASSKSFMMMPNSIGVRYFAFKRSIGWWSKHWLGVDGAASEDSQNLLEQMRWAMMLQRGRLQDVKGLKLREAFYMATKGGAKNLGRDDIGELCPGFAADFVAWNTKGNLSLAGSLHDPVSSLVLCTPGPVLLRRD
eukprot:jgi/Picre1/33135/NNA_008461.t1